ncbi:hypothetical protein JKP88DRAFT_264488 [Tribonema minus]|uniref:Uncharacterized protein n=1 Tax=Tribonema minus TaxID=303371 RepID=A0A835YNX6_9STRA|nr:hypothetical protein JKP88DRAFT_264488 [Tribonema minus]
MTEIVQVAPAWAQPKGRFPRHHKMGDYVTVSAEERLLLVPTHTLTPLVLPKGAQVRFALAAGDKRTHFGTVVEDFVAASEKLFVNHLDAINPYVWVRDNDGGRTWQVPVSELDLRGDAWWSRPVLPVAPFKGEGWNLWPGPTLAWLVENEEDTSVALSIKPARLRWGIPNYARKTGRTMTIEHVPVRAEFLFSGWQQDKRSPAPVLRVKDSAIAPNSGWEVRQAMGGSSAQGERAGTSAHDVEVEVEPQRKLKPPPGQPPSSARSSLGQRQNAASGSGGGGDNADARSTRSSLTRRQNAESGSGGEGDDGDARSTRSSLRQRKNAAGGGGGGGGDNDDDSSDTDADARHDRSSRNRSRDARGGKGDRPPRRAQGRSGGGGGDDGGSSGDGGGVEEDSEGESEVEVDALADNAEFGAKSGTHIVATQVIKEIKGITHPTLYFSKEPPDANTEYKNVENKVLRKRIHAWQSTNCEDGNLSGEQVQKLKWQLLVQKAIEHNVKVLLLENVPQLGTTVNGVHALQAAHAAEYHILSFLLAGEDVGFPNLRKRVFFLMVRGDEVVVDALRRVAGSLEAVKHRRGSLQVTLWGINHPVYVLLPRNAQARWTHDSTTSVVTLVARHFHAFHEPAQADLRNADLRYPVEQRYTPSQADLLRANGLWWLKVPPGVTQSVLAKGSGQILLAPVMSFILRTLRTEPALFDRQHQRARIEPRMLEDGIFVQTLGPYDLRIRSAHPRP